MKKFFTLFVLLCFAASLQVATAGAPMPSLEFHPGETASPSQKEAQQLEKRQKKMDRFEKLLEKKQDKILKKLDQVDGSNASDETKAMTKNLRYAIFAGAGAVILSILAVLIGGSLGSVLGILSGVLWIVGIVFLILWLVNDVG